MIELDTSHTGAKIRAIGIGGAGCNAIDNMITDGLKGVDFIAANSDTQALCQNKAEIKIQVGKKTACGLGVGGNPEVGKKCIEEDVEDVKKALSGSNMVFISAGMGGGTGTGGAPQVAKIARELGALVVAIVTKPFNMEGAKKKEYAENGIEELRKNVDSLIVVSNQKLLEVIDKNTPFFLATKKVDEVLINATKGIVDVIYRCGYMNVDFADIRNIMQNSGDALIGIGIAKGENRALLATQNALTSPLLDGVTITGAKGILLNITCDEKLTMNEIETIASSVQEAAGADAYLKFGIVTNPEPMDEIIVTVVATGFDKKDEGASEPVVVKTTTDTVDAVNPAKQNAGAAKNAPKAKAEQTYIPEVEQETIMEAPAPAYKQAPVVYQPPQPAHSGYNISQYPSVAASSYNSNPNAPKGSNELRKYDKPAYERKAVNDSSYYTDRAADYLYQQEEPVRRVQERPAFLRKMMD
jgi:cell division protein FtsZ